MKIRRDIIGLLFVILALLVSSCTKQESISEKQLERAEKSLTEAPERSLAVLDSIDLRSLDDGENAKYALLRTMAYSINGIEETNDSLIREAVAYYRDNGPRELLMKSLFMNASINKNARKFGDAVLAATESVALAKEEDNCLWMAKGEELLSFIFRLTQKKDDCLKHSQRAAEYYKKAGRTINHWFCLTDVVSAYTMDNEGYGKAATLLDSIERVVTDSAVLSECLTQRIYIYINKKEYQKADRCMQRVMCCRPDYHSGPVEYTWLALIRHSKGDVKGAKATIDSARSVARDALDNVCITSAVYEMTKEDGDYARAMDYADSIISYQERVMGESFRQSVVSAQRDYYNSQAKREVRRVKSLRRISASVLSICLIVIVLGSVIYRIRLKIKNNQIESKMNEILVLSERVQKDDKENRDLKVLAERSMRNRWDTVNMLCNEYFENGDDQKQKNSIIAKVDKEIERICSKRHMEEIEALVNKSMDGIVDKLRAQCPELKPDDVLFATLVYAGLAPRAVCLCTNIKLKYYYTKRTRLMERINNSSAHDKEWFVSKLWNTSSKDVSAQTM